SKGIDRIIDLARLAARGEIDIGPDVQFCLAGPLVDVQMAREVAAADARGDLVYLGPVMGNHRDELFDDADVLIHLSRDDVSPLVIIEAVARGCFPLATSIGCIPEMLENSPMHLVNDGDDAEEVAAKLRAIRLLGRAGRSEVVRGVAQSWRG
ncbi:MAG: glycosyltransferase family 4 protein, partial [Anaerolineae bacterium]|nr:glycosyltransferase family 4 protein [Anaerolineae bacterium]